MLMSTCIWSSAFPAARPTWTTYDSSAFSLLFFFFFLKLNSCHFVATTTVARSFNAMAANEIIESMF